MHASRMPRPLCAALVFAVMTALSLPMSQAGSAAQTGTAVPAGSTSQSATASQSGPPSPAASTPQAGDTKSAPAAKSAPPEAKTPPPATTPPAPLPPGVFLRINGQNVPRQKFIDELFEVQGDAYREPFIVHVVLDQKAKTLGVSVPAADVDAQVKKNVDQILQDRFHGDAAKMGEGLKERGWTLDGFKRRLAIDGRYELLSERMILKERSVSEEALHRVFEEKYGKDGVQTIVRHIQKNVLVAASQAYTLQQYDQEKPKIEEEAKTRAEEALKKIRAGESFETVMAAYSDDPRKIAGGQLGTAWKGRFGADFDKAASSLAKDQTSELLKAPDGYRIVQCTAVEPTEEVHAAHILVATGGMAKGRTDEEARKRAEGLLAQVRGGTDFAQLARDNSDDPASAKNGGDLGFFARPAMVKEFSEAAFSLQPGQVSGLVKSTYGYHIIKLIEKRASEDRTLRQILVSTQFSVVKDRKLRPALEQQARAELESVQKELEKPGATFADLAKTHSDDGASKSDGGLIKNYREGIYAGEFDEAVRSLKAGDPPRIVKDATGNLHLVMTEGTVRTDIGSVRESLRKAEMEKPVSAQERSDYISKLRQAATVLPDDGVHPPPPGTAGPPKPQAAKSAGS